MLAERRRLFFSKYISGSSLVLRSLTLSQGPTTLWPVRADKNGFALPSSQAVLYITYRGQSTGRCTWARIFTRKYCTWLRREVIVNQSGESYVRKGA